jgi:hypothetical protein
MSLALPHYQIVTEITMAALFKAWNIFDPLNTGNVGSNPSQDMDVFVRLLCLCCSVCR